MNFDAFADSLLDTAWLTEPSLRQDAKEELLDTLFHRLTMACVSRLSDDKQIELENFNISTDEERSQLFSFFQKNISDLDKYIIDICDEFAQEYLEEISNLK